DRDKIVITDLESTNGTKVNGEAVQLRILRFGDLISVGRSVLLYGSREQISRRLSELRGDDPDNSHTIGAMQAENASNGGELAAAWAAKMQPRGTPPTLQPPERSPQLHPAPAGETSRLRDDAP